MHLFKVLPICWMLSWTHCKGFLFIPLNNCMKQVFFMPGFHMRKLKLRQINWFAQHHKKLGKTRWIHIQTQFFFGCEASCGILLPQSGEVSSPNHWTSRELPQTLFWIKITPLQYSCLENLMDGGAWWAAVHVSLRVRHDWATLATHSSVLAWRIPGTGEPGALPSMGSHRVGHDWSDLAAAAAVAFII